jgi:hypothetical protein
MPLHPETFDYLRPTDEQMSNMDTMRKAAAKYADVIDAFVPDGPDKTYILRKLRELSMWVNVAITREADGSPRA